MNLPNQLTILRFILTAVFIFFLVQNTLLFTLLAFGMFLAACVTDFLDGYIARKYSLITPFGKIMDPIADKFLILSAFYVFIGLGFMAWWMFWVIFIREAGITVWRLIETSKGKVIAAENLGKYKTVLQMATIIIVLIFLVLKQASFLSGSSLDIFAGIINILMVAVVVLTLVSGVQCLMVNCSKKENR